MSSGETGGLGQTAVVVVLGHAILGHCSGRGGAGASFSRWSLGFLGTGRADCLRAGRKVERGGWVGERRGLRLGIGERTEAARHEDEGEGGRGEMEDSDGGDGGDGRGGEGLGGRWERADLVVVCGFGRTEIGRDATRVVGFKYFTVARRE
jgi:hypothetical protein